MASEMTVAEIAVRFATSMISSPHPQAWVGHGRLIETACSTAEEIHAELVKRGHIKAGVPVLDGSTAPCVEPDGRVPMAVDG